MPAKKKGSEEPTPQTFEEALRRLESIVERLERGDVPLEESIRLYEEGIAVSKFCAGKLTQAELTLKRLAKDMEGNFQLLDGDADE
jgi:exodeoxyribonuclease VII small subunit